MKIKSIKKIESKITGDISVEDTHSYQLGNGVVSHNSSTILMCAPGIHPEHSKRYFRIMQVNKGLETAQWLLENVPDMIEESAWSSTNSDYVVYTPITNDDTTLFKSDMIGATHLEKIKFAQEHWVNKGKVVDRCIRPETNHNISCTVIVEDYDEVAKYIFDNQYAFTAVSFVSNAVDKDYSQAPYTSVLTSQELLDKYGDGVMFASGLIVDGLHYYDNNLWEACSSVLNRDKKFEGTRTEVLLKKDWVRRAKQFAKNYFKNDLDRTVYCLKDVHLWYKWNKISKTFKEVDFEQILTKPTYNDVDKYSAVACSGGQCELI